VPDEFVRQPAIKARLHGHARMFHDRPVTALDDDGPQKFVPACFCLSLFAPMRDPSGPFNFFEQRYACRSVRKINKAHIGLDDVFHGNHA
jgi:hypothetical protein